MLAFTGGFVQLLKSLLCLRGYDNRARFIIIIFSCLVSFVILNEVFLDMALAAVIGLLLCVSISFIATQRRLNDAQLHRNWILAPAGSFLISGLIITFIGHGSIYWLLLIPLLLSLLLQTYPSKRQRTFILGYCGPVDLSEYLTKSNNAARSNQRIEPTMNKTQTNDTLVEAHVANSSLHQSAATAVDFPSPTRTLTDEPVNDIGEFIRHALFSHKNARITISVVSFLIILAIIISLIFSGEKTVTDATPNTVKNVETESSSDQLQHHITLPDKFSLMVTTYEGIVINWQADSTDNNEYWNIANAQGDKSCQSIEFNQAGKIRSIKVDVQNNDQYYAYFSPLDTKALVKNIAFKGSFSLCGYKFSLKGSQTALGKNEYYANLIEY